MNKYLAPANLTVDQLLALNDEIQSLSRAGVPLERGLRALGGDLPGRLGRLADSLGQRLERGESLVNAVELSEDGFPPAYRAVVAAGMRSGRLPAALESISRSVRQASELRRTLIVAMIYPFLVVTLATALFTFSMWKTVPVMRDVFESMQVRPPDWYVNLTSLSQGVLTWLPWIWAALLICAAIWWFQSRRAVRWGSDRFPWLPTIGAVRHAGRMATFTDLLAMLVEQQIPLPEAVTLAASAGGGRDLQQAGATLVQALSHGDSKITAPHGIPPMLTWLILTSGKQPYLVRALRQSAEAYRRRAIRLSAFLGSYFPIFLSAGLGGALVVYYVVLTMGPFYYLMLRLAEP